MKTKQTILMAAALSLAACEAAASVPDAIRPSAEQKLALELLAAGVQVYECAAGQWKFKAPAAILMDRSGKPMGTHFGGPTWKFQDGSEVVAELKGKAPAANGAIPLLLLGTKSTQGRGQFERVSSIQRLDTVGGQAPAGSCKDGEFERIPYTATYYFYER